MSRTKIALIGSLTLLGLVLSVNGATLCIGPTATGSGNGSDWNNMDDWATMVLTRGNTYYLADGNYAGKTFTTAASGSTEITIKKATVGDATVEAIAGWTSTLGDGQANFTGTVIFGTSHWIFDAVKYPWWETNKVAASNAANYGFTAPTTLDNPLRTFNVSIAITNIQIIGFGSKAPAGDTEKWFWWTDNSTLAVNGVVLRRCMADGYSNMQHNTGVGTQHDGDVTEHCLFMNTYSTAANHGEDLNNNGGRPKNWTIRWNCFWGTQGTGPTMIIGALNNDAGPYFIYGNEFIAKRFTDAGIAAIDNTSAHTLTGWAHNNTFSDCQSANNNVRIIGGAGNNTMDARNNVFISTNAAANTEVHIDATGTISHNATRLIFEVSGLGTSLQTIGSDIFTSVATGDFTLTSNTSAGADLSSLFTTDAFGNAYNGSGTWSRGAFAFVAQGGGEAANTHYRKGKQVRAGAGVLP